MRTAAGVGLFLFLIILAQSALAYQILDINIVEYVDENNSWNGFCWNCGNSTVRATSDDTNAYANVQYGNVDNAYGDINFINTSEVTPLSDIIIYLRDIEETYGWEDLNCSDHTRVNFWDQNAEVDGNIVIHILYLNPLEYIDCNYQFDSTAAKAPLVIYEDYQYRTMVLEQDNNIVVNLVNQDPSRFTSLTNVTLTKTSATGTGGRNDFNFSLCYADGNGTISNCDSSNPNTWTWALGTYALNDVNGTIENPVKLEFVATENDFVDHNTTGFYDIGTISALFQSSTVVSGINVDKVYAVAPADVQVYKRQDPDGAANSEYDGYDWGFNISLTNNTTDINFNLRKMSIWVTVYDETEDAEGLLDWHDFRNPNQAVDVNRLFAIEFGDENYMVMPLPTSTANCAWNADTNRLECDSVPAALSADPYKLAPGATWSMGSTLNVQSDEWWIDLNLAEYPPNPDGNTPWVPVVWGDANFTIASDEFKQTRTLFQNYYTLVERIYIVHDYIIEAKKDVNRVRTDEYLIGIWVHNRGTKNTPQDVYVYDIIPSGFDHNETFNYRDSSDLSMGGNQITPDGNQYITAGTATTDMNGLAVWFDVGPLEADGAPNNADDYNIFYQVIGSGDYNAIDMFIIGVDPILADEPLIASQIKHIKMLQPKIKEAGGEALSTAMTIIFIALIGGTFFIIRA